MAHPFKSQSDTAGKSKMHAMMGAGAKGGWQNGNADAAHDKMMISSSMKKHETEMHAEGKKSGLRLDKHARGGKAKGKKSPKINIKIVSNKGEPPIYPMMAPLGPAGLSGLPPAPPPGMPAGMPPRGMMGMRKHGGKIKRADGGKVTGSSYPKSIKFKPETPTTGGVLDTESQMKFLKRERGGAAMKKYPISGGAEGGLGRLQLSRNQKRARGA